MLVFWFVGLFVYWFLGQILVDLFVGLFIFLFCLSAFLLVCLSVLLYLSIWLFVYRYYLPAALDALHHDEEDDCPAEQQTEDDPPFETPGLVHGGRCVQRGAVPEVGRLRGLNALGDGGTVQHRARGPRKRRLWTNENWFIISS